MGSILDVREQAVVAGRVDDLVRAVQQLSMARNLVTVQEIVRRTARSLTGADGATFVLRDGSLCFYADEDAIAPLWKGKRFPMEVCISGWVMLNRQPVVIPDIYADERVPHDAYRPTFVRSLAMVPIRTMDPVGAVGVYWARERDTPAEDVHLLQALADSTAVALENVRVWQELEDRVRERTAALEQANLHLRAEVAERKRVEQQVRAMAITDDLTGLHNRRGFLMLARGAMQSAPRHRLTGQVVFLDVDGLKSVNDTLGHEKGDVMLAAAGDVLRSSFRDGDIVARVGGDEFAVLVLATAEDSATIVKRIEEATERHNHDDGLPSWLRFSIGVAEIDLTNSESLDELLKRADAAMYEQKRSRSRT